VNTEHPITPSPELVTSLRNSAPHGIRDAGVTRELWLINHAYAAGADQELEACCTVLDGLAYEEAIGRDQLRAARRPKPPSLKERSLHLLKTYNTSGVMLTADQADTIRHALEALDD
jgi:hypothetical protein